MSKKLITACMALVAFAAFVLPATASANKPTLRDKAGVVKTPVKLIGTNVGEPIFWNTKTEVKQVVCNKATLTGEATKNEGGTVEGKVSTFTFSGTGALRNGLNECTDSFGGGASIKVTRTPLTLSSTPAMGEDEFQVQGTNAEGKPANIRFDIEDTTVGTCEYEATQAVNGTFTTGEPETTLTTRDTETGSGSKLVAGGFLCPTSGVLAMKFTLETENGEKIWVEKLP